MTGKLSDLSLSEHLAACLTTLPNLPGVYQYFDSAGLILYVGKAKNLRKRVASYFNRSLDDEKTRVLVKKIVDIRHIVVDSEEDALLLENNLIKKYQPRYNVLLKDDKTYPWIVIKNEPFPRIFQTRNLVRDGSFYFGPYTSVLMVRTLLELIKQLYSIRTCTLSLTSQNINKSKFKVCLQYHLGNCKGPCIGAFDEETYSNQIDEIKNILKGNISSVTKYLNEKMQSLASEFRFEDAELVKQKLVALDKFQSKSTIVSPKITNVDVFSIIDDEKSAYINYLKVINGAIIQAHTVEYRKRLNESRQELLTLAIGELRERFQSDSVEVIVPIMPEILFKGVSFLIPKIGDKKKLLELSERNVTYYRFDKLQQQSIMKRETNEDRILNTLQHDLHLDDIPNHIECFDNSNIQGSNPVAACVVFKNGKPAKKDYRHFNVKTVIGPDDFQSMREIVFRRYRRQLDENGALPKLIIIDGGKGQLSAAIEALDQLDLKQIPVIGIAKRLEEIYFPGDSIPLYLDKNSESLKLIQQLRNEAHRFGISFHRDKRSSDFIKSELEQIKGVGENTIKKLLTHFKSVGGVKLASIDEISDVIGQSKALIVHRYFNQSFNQNN